MKKDTRPPIDDFGPRDYSTGSRTGRWPYGTLEYWRHLARERKVTATILNRGLTNAKALGDIWLHEKIMHEQMGFVLRVLYVFMPGLFNPVLNRTAGASYRDWNLREAMSHAWVRLPYKFHKPLYQHSALYRRWCAYRWAKKYSIM